MKVSNRQEMSSLLEGRMTGTYQTLSKRQRLEPDTSLLKTYLVEAHIPHFEEDARDLSNAERAAALLGSGIFGKSRIKVDVLDDPNLVYLEVEAKSGPVTSYVDVTNPRFWLIHSMSGSSSLDWSIQRMIKAGPTLDRVWFPAQLLEKVSLAGPFRGLGLDFDRRMFIAETEELDREEPVEFLKMQLWGNRAGDILKLLRTQAGFENSTTLAKVKVKFFLNRDGDQFSLDDVKYDGKITARGNSFDSHLNFVSKIYRHYIDKVTSFERAYQLCVSETHNSLVIDGEPVSIELPRHIEDVEQFCSILFSCSEPFRLWGVPVKVSRNMYRVKAVDLHIGRRLDLELTNTNIRVYLQKGTCGNSLMRFYTNLQHHYDSRVTGTDSSGVAPFEF